MTSSINGIGGHGRLWHRLCYALISIMCCLALPVQADDRPPLRPEEQKAIIAEIKAMVNTSESQVNHFIVKEATSERIERLYRDPEFLRQPTTIRENGLIFAGQSNLLTFEKPSDIINKIDSWFPQEIATARASQFPWFHTHIHLYGPFANWQAEQAAFLGVWNCMPQVAWLYPDENPFKKPLSGGIPMLGIAGRSSDQSEYDFGFCIRERNGRTAWTEEDRRMIPDEMRATSEKVIPVLQYKFSDHLLSNRCKGIGPDDCVLILHLWASLTPADPKLASSVQALEQEISPDSPLSNLTNTIKRQVPAGRELEPKFVDALRKAAYLRAKLLSVLNSPASWPSSELATTLHQMTMLRQKIIAVMDYRWSYYDIDYYNESIDPWNIVFAGMVKHPLLREAVMTELNGFGDDISCEVFEPWVRHGGSSLQTSFALQQITAKRPLRCAWPDWAWIKRGSTEEARHLRESLPDLLAGNASGPLLETLLNEFTNNAKECFDEQKNDTPDWQRKFCSRWMSEPQTVPFSLPHSGLALSHDKLFSVMELQSPPEWAKSNVTDEQGEWLARLVPEANANAAQKIHDFATDLYKRNVRIERAKVWRHPQHGASLIELSLHQNEGSHVVLAANQKVFSVVNIPWRFRDKHNEIVRVSDLDEDGNLELWWAESFAQCHGDESDLERDIDCTAKKAEMGEIQGNVLTYFVKSEKQSASLLTTPLSKPSRNTLTSEVTHARDANQCNTILIGSVLANRLDIDFGGNISNGGRGDVINIACKPHPLYPEKTIVALFYDLKDKQGGYVEDKKGFAYAVIDVKRKLVLSLYKANIEEDASIRISGSGSLEIDTARYNLAPGVRALGVRMNIGYSPRCAEGGESEYLTLFIEDGNTLKPVLKDLPMSLWRVTAGYDCGNEVTDFTTDSVKLTLEISNTSSEGWHDLEVVAHHQIEMTSAMTEASVNLATKKKILGKLRAKGKSYSATLLNNSLWQ